MPPKGKRGKKKVDPNRPKRPASSFMYFANQKRPEVRSANPTMAVTDVAKQLGLMWKEMTEEQKAPFVVQANVDRKRYQDEMEQYVPPSDDSSSSDSDAPKGKKKGKGRGAGKKKKKDPNAPKRGKSSFFYFAAEQRPIVRTTNPDMSFADIGKTLGLMWGELGAEQQRRYQELAAQDKLRYERELAHYTPPADSSSSSSSETSDSSTSSTTTSSSSSSE